MESSCNIGEGSIDPYQASRALRCKFSFLWPSTLFFCFVFSLNILGGVFGGFLCSSNVKSYELRGMDVGMSMKFVHPLL
jgi:hypothetical protein